MAMMSDFRDRLTALGEKERGPDSVVDRRWLARGIGSNRVQSSLDVVLTFVDSAREGTDISEATLTGLMRAMFDERGPAREVRDRLTRDPVIPTRPPHRLGPGDPLDPPIDFPPDIVPLDDFMTIGCVQDVMSGLAKLGALVQSVARARPKQGAVIDSIEPRAAMTGQQLTIRGSGFGEPKAADVEVYVDNQRAPVVTWSGTIIIVTVPGGVIGDVCVSVLENVDLESSTRGDAIVQAVEVGSTMTGCFGISRVGERLAAGTAALLEPHAECGPTNHIWVGAPAIDTFVINGSSTSAQIRPQDLIELRWVTRYADQVRLQSFVRSGVAPAAVVAPNAQVAASDVRRIGPSATRLVWEIDYILTASNAAGSRQATVRAAGTFAQAMAFLGAGTRSIFHAGALEYLPVPCKTAPRAVSSTGLGALGALSAATTFGNAAPLLASWNTINAAPMSPPPQNARAFDVMSRLISEDPTVRQAFEAYEQGMYSRLLLSVDVMVNEAMLSYADAPVVGDIPIAITDDESILENKVIDALKASGMWVARNVIGPALEGGGVSDSEMGKVTAPAKALVEEAIVGNAIGGGINAVGIGLMNVNPVIAVVFVVAANVIKGLVEGAFDIGKADALRAALATRALCGRAPLVSLIDDFISRSGLQGRTVGTSTGVALAASILETGEPAYVDGFATARTTAGGTIGTLGWRDSLLAVTAVPGALAPVTAGAVNLVDAAFSDIGPLEILQRRDVDEIIVIHGTCNLLPSVQSPDSFSTVGFLTLARRGERVRSASLALTGVEPDRYWRNIIDTQDTQDPTRRRWKTRHVMPTIALSNLYAFEHEPGLLSIWRDYGYMRAFDVMAPTLIHPGEDEDSEALRKDLRDRLAVLSDLITGTREAAWRLENFVNKVQPVELGPMNRRNPPEIALTSHGNDLVALQQLKSLICNQVQRRLEMVQRVEKAYRSSVSTWPGDAVPRSRYRTWYLDYEQHGHSFDNISPIDPTGLGRVNPWLETTGFSTGISVPSAPAPSIDPALFNPLP
jgi:hypothetical protein